MNKFIVFVLQDSYFCLCIHTIVRYCYAPFSVIRSKPPKMLQSNVL